MKLCQNLNLLLKRLESDKNHFFDGLFSESRFYRVFSGVIYTKSSGIFSDDFYDFTIKKKDFLRKGGQNLEASSETPWKTRVRRPGSLE